MKKTLLTLIAFFSLTSFSFASVTYEIVDGALLMTNSSITGRVYFYDNTIDDYAIVSRPVSPSSTGSLEPLDTQYYPYEMVGYQVTGTLCGTLTRLQCENISIFTVGPILNYLDENTGLYSFYYKPTPEINSSISNLIGNATSSFMGTIGFLPTESVTWVGTNLIKPIIGGGLALLKELLYWIIAIVVLSSIVYFAFRAFRFYRT